MRRRSSIIVLVLALAGFGLLALFIGRYPKPYWMPVNLLWEDDLAQRLVLNLRLPRILVSILLGTSLASAGLVMQMLFRNPLVEPGFLGVSQGAAFGAALSILCFTTNPLGVAASAALFALLGLAASYSLARRIRYGGWVLRLLLAGIAVSAFFSAGVGVMKYMADPARQLPEIVFWLLGGLSSITWNDFWYIFPVILAGLVVIYLMRWRLNLLSLSDETAFSLGVAVGRERTLLLVASVLVTAAVISVAGLVGWIGLIVPLIARRIAGANSAGSLPLAMALGGLFGLACDTLARTVLAGEIPLGIITSLLGALAFVLIMMRSGIKGGG